MTKWNRFSSKSGPTGAFTGKSPGRIIFLILVAFYLAAALLGYKRVSADGPAVLYLPILQADGAAPSTPTATPSPTATPLPGLTSTPTLGPAPEGQNVFGVLAEQNSPPEDFQRIKAAGVDWTRPGLVVSWASVEPSEGERKWPAMADLEAQILSAGQYSQSVSLIIADTPAWALLAGAAGLCGPLDSAKLPAFSAFLSDLVSRYAHAPFHVRTWELWDTPDNPACWGSTDPSTLYGSAYYAEMLEHAYPAIKAADPFATVLVGPLELRCNLPGMNCPQTGFAQALVLGAGDFYDGIAFQAFDGLTISDKFWGTAYQYGNGLWNSSWDTTGPVALVKAAFLRSQVPFFPKKLAAEVSYQCLCDLPAFETTKAAYIVQVYAGSKAHGLSASFWNSLKGSYSSGLLMPDNTELPAFQALQFAAHMLGEATFVDTLQPGGDLPAGSRGYLFNRQGKSLLVLWYVSDFQYSTEVIFTDPIENAWDALGNPILVEGNSITIDPDHPVFIQFP